MSNSVKENNPLLLTPGSGTHFVLVFFISFVLAKLFSIAFNKIFTNTLTRDEMGKYAIILAAIQTLYTYSALGFPSALTRYTFPFVKKREIKNLRNFIFTGLIAYQTINLLIIVVFIILYVFYSITPSFLNVEPYIPALLVVGAISISQIFSTILYTTASALQNSRYYSIPVIMRSLLQIPFGVFFVSFLDLGVYGLVLGLVTSELIVACYSAYILIRDVGIGKFSWGNLRDIVTYSLPTYFINILFSTYMLGILTYTSQIAGYDIVALYKNGALIVVNLIMLAGQMFNIVYRPIVFKYFEMERKRELQEITINISKLFIITFVSIGMLIFAFSPFLIILFSQSIYLPSIPVIPLLLIAYFFDYLRVLVGYGNMLYYKTYWNLICGGIALIVGVTTGILVIPLNGLIGLGLSLMALRLTQFIAKLIVSLKYFPISYDWKLLMKLITSIGIASGTGGLLFLLFNKVKLQYSLTLANIIGFIVFLALILILKLFTPKDVMFLRNIVENYIKVKRNNNSNKR